MHTHNKSLEQEIYLSPDGVGGCHTEAYGQVIPKIKYSAMKSWSNDIIGFLYSRHEVYFRTRGDQKGPRGNQNVINGFPFDDIFMCNFVSKWS